MSYKQYNNLIDVNSRGAVILGPEVVCDGFRYNAKCRVQTHVHTDHMDNFDTSKGHQDIYVSNESYDLLVLEKNADLPYRNNFISLNYSEPNGVGDCEIELISSGHMLGTVQTKVTLP
ncbi:hypothetical protein LCGC14_3062140, partial [marine sediment metagenome]